MNRPEKVITIRGSFVGSLGEFIELVELTQQGEYPEIPIIDERTHSPHPESGRGE